MEPVMRLIPYPLRAVSINVRFIPFGWNELHFRKRELNEFAKEQGETQWWLRIGPIQVSYARML
jgi:hypothetical protein